MLQPPRNHAYLPISTVFSEIKRGDFHASSKLETGDVPLVSCDTLDDGIEGYFDIPTSKTQQNCVTITCDGVYAGTAFFRPYRFAAKDNVLVCRPKKDTSPSVIYYIVALINAGRWRFCYARKCYLNKVGKILIPYPVTSDGAIDAREINRRIKARPFSEIMPRITPLKSITGKLKFRLFELGKLFHLERGDFHSLSKLEQGYYPTVSRISSNNGVVGHYMKPSRAHVYPPSIMTVSTVTGDTFIQFEGFMSTDNVVMCIPKNRMKLTTLFFIANMMNRMKWRYSYGRQCYKTKLAQTKMVLPAKDISGELDEDVMEKIVTGSTYWDFLQSRCSFPVISVKDFSEKSGKKIKSTTSEKEMPLEAFPSSEPDHISYLQPG